MSEHQPRLRTTIKFYSTEWSEISFNSQAVEYYPVKTLKTQQMSGHHVQCAGCVIVWDVFEHIFLKLLSKYSIKDTKYNCFKAGCSQVTYGIKNMQYSYVYLYIHIADGHEVKACRGPHTLKTKDLYSH